MGFPDKVNLNVLCSASLSTDSGQDLGKERREEKGQKQRRRLSCHSMSLSPWLGAQVFSMKNGGRRALAPLPDGTRPHDLRTRFESAAPGLHTPPAAPRAHALAKQGRKVSPLATREKPKALRAEGTCPLTQLIKSRPRFEPKPPKRLPQAWRGFFSCV